MSGKNPLYRYPCLSILQPWASLLVCGISRIEGRSWPVSLRGRMWIHASHKVPDDATIKATEDFYREIYAVDGITDLKFPESYPVSRLIGCVEVVGCVKGDELKSWKMVPEGVRLEAQTNFCWLCEKPQKLLIPIEMPGYQVIFNLEKKIFDAAVTGLTAVKGPMPVQFPLPNPKDSYSLKPGSIALKFSESKVSEMDKSSRLNAAIAGPREAATQSTRKDQNLHTNVDNNTRNLASHGKLKREDNFDECKKVTSSYNKEHTRIIKSFDNHSQSRHDCAKRRKKESTAWNHFTKKESDNGITRAHCNYCSATYACDTGKNGTTNLHRHLGKCVNFLASVDDKQEKTFFNKTETEVEGSGSTNSINVRIFNEEQCRQKLSTLIVMEQLPFCIVESKWFVDLLNELQPRFNVPSRKTLANDIFKMYVGETSKLEAFFGQLTSSICLTTNTWTSMQNVNYMVVTAHFIDSSWSLQRKIINVCVILDHKEETIALLIEKCLSDWNINRLLTVTVDNVSSNEAALNILVKNLKEKKPLVLGGNFMHLRFFTHIVNLVVTNGIKDHNNSIEKIRKAVNYVRSSPARMQKFKTCIESANITCKNNVCLDVPTRWNSTYLMLQNAVKFEKAFDKLGECDMNYTSEFVQDDILTAPPSEEDWLVVRELITLLKVFYEVTLKVSSTMRVTANIFFAELCRLHLIIKKYVVSENTLLRSTALNMNANFEKYWGDYLKVNHFMYVAVVLDPRFKLQFVRFCLLKLHSLKLTNEILIDLDVTIRNLYAEYKGELPKNIDVEENFEDSVEDLDFLSSFIAELKREEFGQSNELDRYLSAKLEKFTEDEELLHWWKMHTSDYPTLSRIARDILSIPISTITSESAFSCGRRVLDSFRSSLSPKSVENIICLESWIRDTNRQANVYESLQEETEFETALTDTIDYIE